MVIRAMTCHSCHFDIFRSDLGLKSMTTTIHIMWGTMEHFSPSGTDCVGLTVPLRRSRRKNDWKSSKKRCRKTYSNYTVVGTEEITMKLKMSCNCITAMTCNYYYLLCLYVLKHYSANFFHSWH